MAKCYKFFEQKLIDGRRNFGALRRKECGKQICW